MPKKVGNKIRHESIDSTQTQTPGDDLKPKQDSVETGETLGFYPEGRSFDNLRACVQAALDSTLDTLYVCGPSGSLATTIIKQELRDSSCSFKQISPPFSDEWLFEFLRNVQSDVVLVRNSELLYDFPDALQLLMPQFYESSGITPVFRYSKHGTTRSFEFMKTMMFVSNRRLEDDRTAQLFANENFLIQYEIKDYELKNCLDGIIRAKHVHLTLEERREAAKQFEEDSKRNNVPVDVRRLKAWLFFQGIAKENCLETSIRDLSYDRLLDPNLTSM